MVKWTEEQEEAIFASGQDILVAAAAGSGKTAVLVERMIQKLLAEDQKVNIDSLLVVTFTNAAAQEMRERIGKALEKALTEYPSSNHLKKQLSLLQRAPISTLHSFCMEIVRQYAYLLDVDPSFRIGNPLEIDLMKQDVMDELLEEWYGVETEESEAFFQVVDRFSNDRNDTAVEKLILDLYTFSQQNPYPNLWLDRLADQYNIQDDWKEEDLGWLELLRQFIFYRIEGMIEEAKRAREISMLSDGPYHYVEAIDADLLMFEEALKRLSVWDDLQEFVGGSSFVNLSRKRVECDSNLRKEAKEIRDRYKKRWEDMRERYFQRNLVAHIEDMKEMYPIMNQLTLLVKDFSERFTQHKQAAGMLDFSDLEHYSLQLLIKEGSRPENPEPSEVALQFKNQFTEVLVDEYQDINLVQETILSMLSDQDEAGNRFMVGDVKQSVYGFRHAEPDLFIEKYNRFIEEGSHGKRIDLAKNFRSREPVLSGANYIFRQIFDENIGEIEYDQAAELIYANKMYDEIALENDDLELILIDRDDLSEGESSQEDEDFTHLEKAELEARLYAQKIKGWMDQKGDPLMVHDKEKNAQRPVQYRDIVILLRSMTNAPVIVEELKRQGIPVYAELATGYFAAIEIKVMINLLKIIDNPRQDIPLASVLKSPIVGLNEEELASIRIADKGNLYYDALQLYVKNEEANNGESYQKIKQFLDQLARFQFLARQGALSELIWEIYRVTGYYDFVGGIPGGRQRQANLRALYDRARNYETTSFRGLFRFLRFIERMEERGDDLGAARALSELENVVKITTIHKSKGLEYPVVIVGSMAHGFNLQDLNKRYLLHKEYGVASKFIDPAKRIMYPTLFYYSLHSKILQEQLSEEMRVLYVALTRAKEKLLMVGQVNSFEKTIAKWQSVLKNKDLVLPIHLRIEAKNYLDWVGPALMRHKDSFVLREGEVISNPVSEDPSKWNISVLHASELVEEEEAEEQVHYDVKAHIMEWDPLPLENEELTKKIDRRLYYKYPHQAAVQARAKQSVTEIKRMHDEADDYGSREMIRKEGSPISSRPLFMQKEKKLTAAEVGTAMHAVMQHLPFEKALSEEEIEEFVSTLVDKEILTADQAEVIQLDVIESFYKTNIAQLMMRTEGIEREVPFMITLPASEVYPTWEGGEEERVLIQGVIDCLIPTEEGWMILDYKTDQIFGDLTEDVLAELQERYAMQINLYRQAIEEILDEKVSKAYLYYFSKQLLIEM